MEKIDQTIAALEQAQGLIAEQLESGSPLHLVRRDVQSALHGMRQYRHHLDRDKPTAAQAATPPATETNQPADPPQGLGTLA